MHNAEITIIIKAVQSGTEFQKQECIVVIFFYQEICQMLACFNPLSQSQFFLLQAAGKNHNDPAAFQLKICMCRGCVIAASRGRKWIYVYTQI